MHDQFPFLCLLGEVGSTQRALGFLVGCISEEKPSSEYLHLLGFHPALDHLTLLQCDMGGQNAEVYEALAMLGYHEDFPALVELQQAVGGKQAMMAVEWEKVPCPSDLAMQDDTAVLQGPVAAALLQREDELRRREEALAARELEITQKENQLTTTVKPPMSPHKMQADLAGVVIDDEDLKELFGTYDRDGTGFVSKSEFKLEYRSFEDYGLPLTDAHIDRIFDQFGGTDDKLSYEEFCILMLQRAQI
eukprot:TRINITY_DN829_c0_g1_i1.p1 TRINITY_DN829_c0_g1~~TRINITY_DN829_c0_g1_i1.p1  ORF type:complete len:248 (+),score=109.01 TRINITY_DN829_c0_g1_i1:63-806(+)